MQIVWHRNHGEGWKRWSRKRMKITQFKELFTHANPSIICLHIGGFPSRCSVDHGVCFILSCANRIGGLIQSIVSCVWPNVLIHKAAGRYGAHVTHWGPATDPSFYTHFGWNQNTQMSGKILRRGYWWTYSCMFLTASVFGLESIYPSHPGPTT